MSSVTPDAAIEALFQAPLDAFVAERKRLAAELRASGDAKAAKDLLARHKPPLSAWAVNQLWWTERRTFEALIASADQVAKGDMQATVGYRQDLAKLRKASKRILTAAGHPPNEEMLRRVSTTVAAIAANEGFDPDPPGALQEDRDPPGFEAMELEVPDEPVIDFAKVAKERKKAEEKQRRADEAEERRREDADAEDAREREARAKEERRAKEARRKELEAEERRRSADADERRAAARERRMEELREARAEVRVRERDVKSLERQLAAAKGELDDAREAVEKLEGELEPKG